MQANQPDDLSDLERRLSSRQPATEGLNADAMLFAAGQAAGRKHSGGFFWPAMTGLSIVIAAGLLVLLMHEREEKQLLVQRLRKQAPAVWSPPAPSLPAEVAPLEVPVQQQSPDSLRSAQRALEQGLEDWPLLPPDKSRPPRLTPKEPAVFSVGQRDMLLDQ